MPELTGIALGRHVDGSHELVAASVVQGTGATMWHARQTRPGGNWTGWHPFGKPGHGDPGTPAIIEHAIDGRLEVFVTSGDQAVWHRWQTSPGSDDWSDWESLGKPGGRLAEGAVALTLRPDGQVMAVATANGTVWQASSPGRESQAHWPAWSSVGRPGDAPAIAVAAAAYSDGRVELAALAEAGESATSPTIEGNLWHRWQTGPGIDKWSDWKPLGDPGGHRAGIPVFGQNGDGRLLLFTRAADGGAWHTGQHLARDSNSWGTWEALARPVFGFGDMAVRLSDRGLLFLVATEFAGDRLWYATQADVDLNTWCPLSPLAAVPEAAPDAVAALVAPTLGINTDGRMELFVVMPAKGTLYQLSAPARGQLPSVGRSWPHP